MRKHELLGLVDMMIKNNLAGWDDGVKLKHDSYMKGKADMAQELKPLINQLQEQTYENTDDQI
jgi:hypothetical protein